MRAVFWALLALVSACTFESPARIDVDTRARIEVGTTSREEVLLALGLPKQTSQQERTFFYPWGRSGWIVFVPTPYALPVYGHGDFEYLRLDFDASGIVRGIVEGSYDVTIPFEISRLHSYTLATPDENAEAKRFRPDAGSCVVYFYVKRSGGDSFSSTLVAYLQIDGRYVGYIGADGWFYKVALAPGEHVATVVDWKRPDIARFDEPALTVNEAKVPNVKDSWTFACRAGEMAFIEIGYPVFARFPVLRGADATEGRKAVAEGKLVIDSL